VLFAVFSGSYIIYVAYLKFHAGKPWGLEIDKKFCPPVTILIPAYNEGKIIQKKLENLAEVTYSKEKMEVIVIDDASTDETFVKAYDFAENHPELSIKVLKQHERKGKANALNRGLQVSSNDIIVVTDADALLPPEIFRKAMPYMYDPTIGAITGLGEIRNSNQSWMNKTEKDYLGFMFLWRLGESKIHSTLRFEGVFCAFKRNAFSEFDNESGADDSGTALRVVQNKFRAILVPEAHASAEVSCKFRRRIKVKIRRAVQLNGLWFQCLKLLFNGRLMLPKKIAVPEIFFFIFNPFVFVALTCVTFILVAYHPVVLIPLILAFCAASLIPKARNYLVEGIFHQFILFYSIVLYASEKKFVIWNK
jgi:biofilm PGA synthesis N-glycosyltransferase PgaC